ncbi:MAG: T9SS type A sorting domain-containing protein [Saprospiraceae bacterium]
MQRFLILLFVAFSYNLSAQIQEKSTPYTIEYQLPTNDIPTLRYVAPNLVQLEMEDLINDIEKGRQRIATLLPFDFDFFKNAQKTSLNNGKSIFRVKVEIKQAEALGFFFQSFELATNDKFFIFNENGNEIQGAFTSISNSKNFGTALISGENIILEYVTNHTEPKAKIRFKELSYAYRMTGKSRKRDFGDSGSCHVNANCSEGNNWANQKKSVVRILVKDGSSQFWCSGALINNERQDCTPYLLTAEHCGVTASVSDISQWIFYFNYQASACNNPPSQGSLANTFLTGAIKRAQSNDSGGDTGSDFMLLELTSAIPDNYNPYFAGWDRQNTPATSGVSIHHPQGDIKKISTYNTTLANTSFGGITPNTHWGVSWAASTNGHGVTESGSSGSPIFDQNKRIVGTLTGGASFCSTPGGQDEYGKMSYHWTSNGSTSANQLKPWLDPDNTGITQLNGVAQPCNTSTSQISNHIYLNIFPNPATNYLNIEWKNEKNISADIRILNIIGQEVATYFNINNGEKISLERLQNGVYFIEMTINNQRIIQKFVVSQ